MTWMVKTHKLRDLDGQIYKLCDLDGQIYKLCDLDGQRLNNAINTSVRSGCALSAFSNVYHQNTNNKFYVHAYLFGFVLSQLSRLCRSNVPPFLR